MLSTLLTCVLAIAGCSDKGGEPPPPPGDGASGAVDTDGPAPELPCEESGMISAVTAEVTDAVSSVVAVRWTTAEPAVGQVWFGETADYGAATPVETEAVMEHEALLLGLAVNTGYHLRVVVDDGAEHCSDDLSVQTGTIPSSLAEVGVSDVDAARSAGGYTIVPILAADLGSATVAIFDEQGRYSWYYEYPDGLIFRATVSRDRQRVLFNGITQAFGKEGSLNRVSWDGETVERIAIPDLHNDFVELPEGNRYAGLQWELREYEDAGQTRQIVGSRIIEFDATGDYDVIWDAFDEIPVDLDQVYQDFLEEEGLEDWLHLNFLYYDEETDAYLTPSFYQNAILSIDRGTGSLNWVMGGDIGDIPITAGSLTLPHSVVADGGQYLVFQHTGTTECSRASLFDVDLETGEATEQWTYESDECLLIFFLGSAEVLWNDNRLITWSTSGQIDEITPGGELVWRLRADLGTGFGFGTRVESLYP